MKRILFLLFCLASLTGLTTSAQTLVHYWNFNNSASENTLLTPTLSLVNGAGFVHVAGTNATFTSAIMITSNTTGQGFEISNPNARNSDAAGAHLRLNNPIGGKLIIALPTTGYKDVVVKYATRRSGSGAYHQVVDYSLDGNTFVNLTTLLPVDGNPTLQTLDFTSIIGANNNPNFKIRIGFMQGAGGLEGNNRFDNFSLDGTPIPVAVNTLLHYWNFNNSATEASLLTPTVAVVGGSSFTHVAGTNATFASTIMVTSNTTGQGFETTNPNARNSDVAGAHLRLNNPIGGKLIIALPTTGYTDIVAKYGTRRSGSGAYNQVIDYSLDGTTFLNLTTLQPVDGNPTLQTLDFTAITGANNNPNFKIRIGFTQGAGGLEGNNRIDNFSVDGVLAGATDNTPPTVAFSPENNTPNVATNTKPTLTFNEEVKLIDNTALNNTNVDALIELRLNDATGATLAFDATVSGKVITVSPLATLLGSQKYYLALKANSVKDLSNNTLTAIQTTTFTTIAQQTVFQPGDLVPVAYRMNTATAEDEIAFLTTVNILPGTMINLTDAKYTDNIAAQCPGGLVWTAPASGVAAGTVIRILSDASVTANIGTLSGASFGLSSGGDQVILYTGTSTNPAFITALSSNTWLTANTSCSGSNSKLPATLADGQSSINLSTALGNTSGNTVNAYYNGLQSGTTAQLKAAILNPANWIGAASATAPQTWPTYNFPGSPAVTSAKVLSQLSLELTFNNNLDPISAATLANYTGVTGLTAVTAGTTAGTYILTYNTPFAAGTNYTLTVNGIKDAEGRTMFNPYTFAFSYHTRISFQDKFLSVSENVGNVEVKLRLENPAASSVRVVLKASPFSNTNASDLTFTSQTLNFTGTSAGVQTITIPIVNDTAPETDEYFVLSLEDLNGIALGGKQYLTVYIRDDDKKAPVATEEIKLNYVSSFKPNTATGSTTEIVVHDASSQRLYMTSAIQDRLDIADFSNPANIRLIRSIDMKPYGGITSVAVKNGVVAVASPAAIEQENGSVVLFNIDGEFQKKVTVGALPDMITFSPDGKKIMTANEGQPNDAYTVDPEGTVSVIDISGGLSSIDQSKVTTISFASFNAQEATLRAAGVRKTKLTSTLAQDLEPEYITISPDSKKAWVTLQENNAIAEINLDNNTVTSVWALGKKDFNTGTFGFDASDNSGAVHISSYPIKSFFMPDGIANFTINGKTYLVSANEGDEKDYPGFSERNTVGAVSLDPTVFPNAAVLKEEHNLGRLRITNLDGDIDGDGDFDELIMNGSRSFSIWDVDARKLVYDSKDDFELFTAKHPIFSAIFNADNESNTLKSRSRAKGPEPEGVTVATINGAVYAFVTLERVGGVIVYNITDPNNPKLVDYKNNRLLTSLGGDLGPEGIIYIRKEDSPDGKGYIAIANEISGNISVFSLVEQNQTVAFSLPAKTFGDVPFAPTATSNTGATVTFTSSNTSVAVVENGTIRIIGAGMSTITAAFPAAGGYSATTAQQTLTVAKKELIVTAENKSRLFAETNPPLTVTITGFVNGNTSAVFTTQPMATTLATPTSAVGSYAIIPSGAAAANYSFNYVNGALIVGQAVRTITFATFPTKTYLDPDFGAGATVSSGETVTYSSSNINVATIVGGAIHIVGAGTTTITASVPVNLNYTTAPALAQLLTVNKAAQTISFLAIPKLLRGAPSYALQVNASSGLPVLLSSSNVLVTTLNGKQLSPIRIGTSVITATQAGDANFLAAAEVNQTLSVVGSEGQLVRIHGALSPDGDNINDFLIIEGAQNFPDNQVTILDRSGRKVFGLNSYDNQGKVFRGRNTSNEMLPAGTYYCLLVYQENGEQKRVTNYFVIRY